MNDETVATIRVRSADGSLLGWLIDIAEKADRETQNAYDTVVALHAAGDLDAMELLFGSGVSWKAGADYLARTRLYRSLLPRIGTSAERMVEAVRAVKKGMWSPCLDQAFRDWCEAASDRPDDVVRLHRADAALDDRFLVPALAAGYGFKPSKFLTLAIELTRDRNRDPTCGVLALAAMNFLSEADRTSGLEALVAVARDADVSSRTRSFTVFAAFSIFERTPDMDRSLIVAIVEAAATRPQTDVVHESAMALAKYAHLIPESLRALLMEVIAHLDTTVETPFNAVDHALDRLLQLGLDDEAFGCLERLVSRTEDDLFDRLNSTAHDISHGDRARLGRLLVRFIASGRPVLCSAARALVMQSGDRRLACDGPVGNAKWSDERTVFVARKAVGWLMPHSTAPASIVVGLLREARGAAASELASLLLDPLLSNYPLAMKSYLGGVVGSLPEAAAKWVAKALHAHEEYLEGLEGVGTMPELRPSRRHARLAHRLENARNSAASREARTKSPLMSMMSTSLILHGRHTICRVKDFDGTERRIVTEMKQVRTEMDRVLGLTYDPVGLDLMLLQFRVEPLPP